MNSKIKKIISICLIILGIIFFSVSLYIKNIYSGADFEQILYNFMFAAGTSWSPIIDGVKYCLPIVLICTLILIIPVLFKKDICLNFYLKKKKRTYSIAFVSDCIYSICLFTFFVVYALSHLGFFEYMDNQKIESEIFDKYYVAPGKVDLIFPENKRNLIYIYLESMESSFASYTSLDKEINLIPNLSKLAEQNSSFSNSDSLGGAYQVYGTTYTVASMISQTAGVPLKTIIEVNTYGKDSDFLPGITSLGDILEKNGYNQYILMGSNSSFAARDKYFSQHGNYNIYDHDWAIEAGYLPEGYNVWWGYEDKKLFKITKEELKKISKSNEPFNFTILTADTHANDGYLDKSCDEIYDDVYANVLLCNDEMVAEFVEWVSKQSFAKNTSVILVGDHLTMRLEISDNLSQDRTIFNTFINSLSKTQNISNRIFTQFDMFPTTLASLGVQIEGNRLGLGTNLFSEVPTYAEELGLEYLNQQLEKKSSYYNTNFLEGTYLDMINELNEES